MTIMKLDINESIQLPIILQTTTMIKQQIIKDKQKLFRKLFISPSYCEPLDPPLLVSPDFINLLLQQSALASKQYQLSIVNDILNVFAQRPTNSLLLCAHDAGKVQAEKCILDSIVFRIMSLIQNQQQVELYLQRILLMISYYRITLRNIQKLTQWLSRMSYQQKFDPIKLMFILRLIKLYYSRKVGQLKSPRYYFYLYGVENSGIQPVQQSINEFSFKNELTIVLSFNSQGQIFKPYNLFLIKTEKKQQIGLSYSKGILKLTALNDGQYREEFTIVKDLSQQVWYRVVININSTETQCIVDNKIYKNRALVKRQRERKITYCAFGREFFGMLGSVVVSNKNIPIEKFDTVTYPFGIDSTNDLKNLNKTQLPASMIASCLPFFVFEVRQTMHCFDIFRRNHSSVGENILILNEPITEDNIEHLGGCTLLLPLFYLARFYNKSAYPTILEDLLQILLEITKIYNIENIYIQFEQTNFLQILGQHMADIPHLQTKKSLSILFKIFHNLKKDKTRLVFIHDVLWVLNIGIYVPSVNETKEDPIINEHVSLHDLKLQLSGSLSPTKLYQDQEQELISDYYKKLLSLYTSFSSLAFQAMSLAEVIYWVVQRLETNENMAFSCCLQHHLNESVLSYELGVDQFVQLDSSHAKTHYLYVEEILACYLHNSIRISEQNVIEEIKTLLRLFLQKYSSCFYLTILRAIKRQIIQNQSKKKIGKILADPRLQIISFLVFLSEKTINPDIISEIMYIALFIQHHSNQNKKDDVTKFIVNLLRINQSIQLKNCNPIQALVKKVRKFSYEESQNKAEDNPKEYELNEKVRRNSMVTFRSSKLTQVQIGKRRLSRIIARSPRPQKLSSFQVFYNIIMNQLSGDISEAQPISEGILYSEESILIMKEYYKLAQPTFKQSILLYLLSSLQKKPQLKDINSLTTFLLESLRQCIYVSPEETKNLLTIFTCILSQVISNHSSILDYYSSIKFLKLSRSTISLVLPHIVSKVVKLADFSQLCDLMVVCMYEIIQSPGESALELSQIILCELHSYLNKAYSNKAESSSPEDEQLLKIVCQHPDRNLILLIEDPFKKNVPEIVEETTKKNGADRSDQNWEELDAADLKEVHVLNQFGLFEVAQRKSFSPTGKGSSKDEKHQKAQQKDNYYKQLSYFQVYVKLFFKVMERLDNEKQLLLKQKKQSMICLENENCLKTKKINEINYSYEVKSAEILTEEFIQIVITFFKRASYNSKLIGSYLKFVLSYVIFKSEKQLNFSTKPNYLLLNLIFRVCKPLINTYSTQIEQVLSNVQKNSGSLATLQFFLQFPYEIKFSDILILKEESISQIDSSSSFEPLSTKHKFSKFFAEIEDLHDLMVVGYYQKNMQKYVEDHQNFVANFASQKSFRNIQRLFDTQNSAEEKTRITFLYQNQCRFRKYHYVWDQLWNNLRIYHKPYGFWMAQKFKDSIYTYPRNQLRNFKFEMSEYSSESGLYPVLQAKILQPWTIIKDNRLKKNKYINSFSEMMKPSHIKLEKQKSQNNILTNVWKGMLGLKKKNLNKLNEYDVVLICRSTKAAGKLFIQNKEDIVFCFEGARQEDTHLSFQKFSLAFNRETYQKWSIFSIEKVKLHRYLLRYQALQIVFCDTRSIIFNFVNGNKDMFLKELEKIQKQKLQTSNLKLYKINKIKFFEENFFDMKSFDPKITQSWIKRQISNLQYLSRVNRAASRGIYDLSQYMVAPWVVEFKKEKEPTFRDLSKTMGGLGSEERKKIVNEKYYTKDPFNPYPPFFFGTHYSSPGVVFNILIRLSPFTQYCKHLQGGKFDIPDRLFASLVSSWRSASEEVSDVRELIPEVYYLPQLLINIDENYFGYTQNRQLIEHVEIPPWGANNPYFFTSQLRQLMESEEVSQKINEWIDLIFGYKQKGKEAEQSYNIYYYLTYEDYIDIDEDEDDVYKKSKEAQIVHFGQVPPLLFEKPHPKRNLAESGCIYQLKIIKSVNLMNSLKQRPIGLKISNNELAICKRNQFEVFSTQSDPAALQRKKKINFEKSLTQTYFLIKKQRSNVVFLEKPYFIVWGYLSNEFRIFNKFSGEIDEEDELPSKITSLIVSKAEDLILIGLASGLLFVYEIQYGINDIFIKKVGSESFSSAIVHISQYDGFYSITFGNYCALYKITRSLHYICSQKKCQIKFFRSFYNSLPLKQCFMMCSPLYTLIMIDNANIRSYSINGQLIKTINSNAKFYNRFRDHQLHDVFYAVDQDKVICFSVPDLRFISILDLPDYEYTIDQYILQKNCIQEIGYGVI